eukprot:TRINITY_DN19482_c0_g1_i4.p1 TRINITY_DN19482_c0_g1~~TRINITY_DN19482_c0_g1_i4.p1  ORF type:complete len:148 (-),score=2.41 TRINITY_DN19482_c0_g1_i4:892-1335(-)
MRHMVYPLEFPEIRDGLLWLHLPGSTDYVWDSSELVSSWPEVHRIVLVYDNLAAIGSTACPRPENVSDFVEYIESDSNETLNECYWAARYQIVTGQVWKSGNLHRRIRRAIDGIRIGGGFRLGSDGILNRVLKLLQCLTIPGYAPTT